MEREALEGGQSGAASPSKPQREELFLFPAESSTLTTLPGVARVVHSKASCTVHWLESGKSRPNAKELPAAQILGIHTAAPPRAGAKSARGSTAAAVAAASVTVPGDSRRTEPPNPEPSSDGSTKPEEKRPQPAPPPPPPTSSQQTPSDEVGPSNGVQAPTGAEPCAGTEGLSEPCKEEPTASSSSPEAPAAKEEATAPQAGAPAAKERAVEQIREEGWSARDADNVTLAELYLMSGKPGKLQLEYEWLPAPAATATAAPAPAPHKEASQENGQAAAPAKAQRTHRVLRCLLRLVATEVNPKPLVSKAQTNRHFRWLK